MVYHYDETDYQSHSLNDDAEKVFKKNGYECIRLNKDPAEGNFIETVAENIIEADVIFVNLSLDQANPKLANPNVLYELGIAHALDKWTIIAARKEHLGELPADIRGSNILGYDQDSLNDFKTKLERWLVQGRDNPPNRNSKSNPISNVISTNQSNESLSRFFNTITGSAKHPLTAVLLKFDAENKPTSATVEAISRKGNEFYGYEEDCTDLKGANTNQLLEKLKDWINPDDYAELEKDQMRIANCITGNKMFIPPAKVPIIFNDMHPNPDYMGRSYYPVWIGAINKKRKTECKSRQMATILYVDLGLIRSEWLTNQGPMERHQ